MDYNNINIHDKIELYTYNILNKLLVYKNACSNMGMRQVTPVSHLLEAKLKIEGSIKINKEYDYSRWESK